MNRSILLIDDEQSFRVIMESALTGEGYTVHTAGTLAEGRALWQQELPELVIIDRNLPDGDGVDLLGELRRENESRNLASTFLVVTAYADVDNAVVALQRGADDYITKPVQLPDLLVKLRKASERRTLERRMEALRRGTPDVVHILRQTRSDAMRRALHMAERVAASHETPVLIEGETGTGKDMVARYVHALTPQRGENSFVELNCAAIAENLAESELFGHERGAFTDAKQSKRGLLELAHEGTLFLDEVGDLGLGVQGKLLRVLETMRFRRVGGTRDREVDVRVVSATHRDLGEAVAEERFRLDLYHRLDVFHLEVPPLRERSEDLLPLANAFVQETARRLGRTMQGISEQACDLLRSYTFPGNIRELKNVMERAVILEQRDQVHASSILLRGGMTHAAESFFSFEGDPQHPPPLAEVERAYVAHVLALVDGNKTQAARVLGVSIPTLRKKLDA